VSSVHVSYCEWLLESVIKIGGTTAVFHNKLRLVQSQWLHDLSEQPVLGLHDLWTCLPVTFTHSGHRRKLFYYNNPETQRPGSSVGIATTGWTVRGSNPSGGEIFRTCPDRH
jgi:hypothetical protein